MRNLIVREYKAARAHGWKPAYALPRARTWYAFYRREAGEHDVPDATHCVRIRQVPDDHTSWADLVGETFDLGVNPDISPAEMRRQEKAERERIERDGVWGFIAEYWDAVAQQWQEVDAIWGFIGEDFNFSGYDDDLKRYALKARAASVRKWRAMCKAAP